MDAAFIQLALWFIFGLITAVLAQQRGRNLFGWFCIGIIGGCFGLALVLVLPDMKKEAAKERREKMEKRRLREQVVQERMKNQAFRGHATHRLDEHDDVLGVNTRAGAGDPALVPPPPPPALQGGIPATNWFIAGPDGTTSGPLSLGDIRCMVEDGSVNANTLVWHNTMSDWKPVSDSLLDGLV